MLVGVASLVGWGLAERRGPNGAGSLKGRGLSIYGAFQGVVNRIWAWLYLGEAELCQL